uniref:DAO domain-containing protein n=1 Tax=Steinernema glaseri TaxID=37863 RepID=A0A1I7ZM69_9BILA
MYQILRKKYNTKFVKHQVKTVHELIDGFDVVVNCAGLNGGLVANDGDADNVYPIRGVILEIDAPWQKNFVYLDFATFTFPTINTVFMGTVKQDGRADLTVSQEDIDGIRARYAKIQPAMNGVRVKSVWSGLRPGRRTIRLEMVEEQRTKAKIIHNYGHGGNGFTLSWGCALEVVELALR